MVEAVMWFAAITAVGELLLLGHMPKFRAWVLYTRGRRMLMHVAMLVVNLWIHWGTMTGTMTGVTAFVISVGVCWLARAWWYPHWRSA